MEVLKFLNNLNAAEWSIVIYIFLGQLLESAKETETIYSMTDHTIIIFHYKKDICIGLRFRIDAI